MALTLILGNSGSGKSHRIYETIIKQSLEHPTQNYLILVPEQFTLQTQQKITEMHPGRGILNIDVLSFDRLAYRVLNEVGGDSRRILEETGKSLVLQKIVQQKKKELCCLTGQLNRTGYISVLKSLISEMMQYKVTEEDLEEAGKHLKKKTALEEKLADIQILYRGFQEYLGENYLTTEEMLDLLAERAGKSSILKGAVLVLDGYTGFTPVQYHLLEVLLSICSQTYVTVTLDEREDPFAKASSHQLFALSKRTIHRLLETAKKAGVFVEEPIWVSPGKNSRFKTAPALRFLERQLFRYPQKSWEKEQQSVHLMEAASPQQEMKLVAAQIMRLVSQEGYRYSDIAVITGDMSVYSAYAAQSFAACGIPYFLDETHTILWNPFVEYLRAAVTMVQENLSYESVFRYLRSGMSVLTQEEVDDLENYCLARGIRGWKKWNMIWQAGYPGLSEEALAALNENRQKFVDEVQEYLQEIRKKNGTVQQRTLALYQFIERCHIQEKLKEQEVFFARQENQKLEKEYAQIYGIVMSLFDKMVEILGDEPVSFRDYQQLLEAGLSEAKVAIIPPRMDQVPVGDMERTRLKEIKALFLVGVNEGIIPRSASGGNLLSDTDRELLANQQITLAPDAREAMYIQKFYLYLNLTKPEQHLYLSYSSTGSDGEKRNPSYLVNMVLKLFPKLHVNIADEEALDFVSKPEAVLERFTYGFRRLQEQEPSDWWKELFSWLKSQKEYQETLQQLIEAAYWQKPQTSISREAAILLYGNVSEHSVTRLEQFAACAYHHFLTYGLRLQERKEWLFQPSDMGTILHAALEGFTRRLQEQGLEWGTVTEQMQEELLEVSLREAIKESRGILESSARNEYKIEKMKKILRSTLHHLEEQIRRGEFQIDGIEVPCGGGRIDRVDVCEKEETLYVKIMDYKTGSTKLDLQALYYGLQLQLISYLNGAIEMEQRKHPDKQVEPAGVFYYHLEDPFVEGKVSDDPKEIEEKLQKARKMSGLVQKDPKVAQLMDRTLEMIPVEMNKNGGFSARSSVATNEQFAVLRQYVKEKSRELKEQIVSGEAPIEPYQQKDKTGCDWCPYQAVCRFDLSVKGFSYRKLPELSEEAFWKACAQKVEKEE